MNMSRPLFATILWLLLLLPARAEILRVVTYNALNFDGSPDADRIQYFRRAIDFMNADIVAMQEITSQSAVNYLLANAYLYDQSDWAAAPFINGPDTDNALFYRTSRVSLASYRRIPSDPRDINEYVLRPATPDTSQRIHIYSVHLKAGQDDTLRRANACVALRQVLDSLAADALFMVVGDFNLYSAAERAYQVLLSPLPNPNGRLFDPIDVPGYPWNNPAYAAVHTQSPRATSFGGGSSGGMDDRFDFILASAALMDTAGTFILPTTYEAVGNDGLHYNQSINYGVNYAVPDSIADALYYASDHLPVAVDILLRAQTLGVNVQPLAGDFDLFDCYPNPFNATLTIDISPLQPGTTLTVYDIAGRLLHHQAVDRQSLHLDFSSHATGTYFVRVQTPSFIGTRPVALIR